MYIGESPGLGGVVRGSKRPRRGSVRVMHPLHTVDSTELHGLFKSLGKAVNKVVSAPLKVAQKVASKVLPDKIEKAVLAPAKLAAKVTAKSITGTARLADRVVSPVARGIKQNPALVQAAGAIASVIPGGQPVGAALLTSGRLMQQRQSQKADEAAQAAQAHAQAAQQSSGPQIITVPGGGGGGSAVAAPRNNTPLYIGAGAAALFALFALTNNRHRR